MRNATLSLGALLAGITIAMGALGAHALKDILNATQLQTYETAVRYQMYHVFALLLIGILQNQYPQLALSICKKLVLVGMVLFGGSIYLVLLLSHLAQLATVGFGLWLLYFHCQRPFLHLLHHLLHFPLLCRRMALPLPLETMR